MKTPLTVISSDKDSVAAIRSGSLRLIRELAVPCHLSSPTWQALRTLKQDESEVTLYANPFGHMDYDEMSAA